MPSSLVKIFSLYFVTFLVFFSSEYLKAEIEIDGVNNRGTVIGEAIYRVERDDGFTISATLDGQPREIGTRYSETRPGYHELSVTKTRDSDSTSESRLLQFIVRDPARDASDKGVPTWTPYQTIDSPAAAIDLTKVIIVTPSSFPADSDSLPLMIRLDDEDGTPALLNATVLIQDQNGALTRIKIRRGAGAGQWPLAGSEIGLLELDFQIGSRTFRKQIELTDSTGDSLSGMISESRTIPAGSMVRIDNALTIESGQTLRFEKGCLVQINQGITINVLGALEVAGTLEEPVIFSASDEESPWNGFHFQGGEATADLKCAFFTGAGNSKNWTSEKGLSAHRREQPVLTFDAGNEGGTCIANLDQVWIVDNPDCQASHGRNAEIVFDRCLIQRTQTTGQFNGGKFSFLNSHAMEFPLASNDFSDADNDGMYLTGGEHVLRDSVIGWAKDDGVDCGGGAEATLLVENCWVESCFHEGFALSGDKLVTIIETVGINNGQALECGYSAGLERPDVTGSNLLLTSNGHGARFGDNYDWNYNGMLSVNDSLIIHNVADVFGFEWDSWTYRSDRMDISRNTLTRELLRHPDNDVLSGERDGSRIANFLSAPDVPPSFGIASANRSNSTLDFQNLISVQLDRPTTKPLSLKWELFALLDLEDQQAEPVNEGDLTFEVGQSRRDLLLPELPADRADSPLILIRVSGENGDAEMAVIESHFIDLPSQGGPNQALIPFGSEWGYLDDGSDQGAAWQAISFDDSGWSVGRGQLGYGEPDQVTEIGYASVGLGINATTYFRHAFEVPDSDLVDQLSITLLYDDGAVVYLNGSRVAAANMPDGEVAYNQFTGRSSKDNEIANFELDTSMLIDGTNVIAVEVHQANANSSDLSFDLKLIGSGPIDPTPRVTRAVVGDTDYLYWLLPDLALQESDDLLTWETQPEIQSPFKFDPKTSGAKRKFYRFTNP